MEHLVLIGAGPHGLAVLVALAARGTWPERVTVVDPHARWCAAWDDKLARLDLDRLRSPQVHHPGVRPMELRDLVEALPAEEQLAWRLPDAQRVPTPAGMRAFIDRLVEHLGPLEWVTGRALGVQLPARPAVAATNPAAATNVAPAAPAAAPDAAPAANAHAPAAPAANARTPDRTEHEEPAPMGPLEIELEAADGTRTPLTADAVVLAHNPSRPRIPGWAEPLIASGRAAHASNVDVRTADVNGRDVLIVGGGLTAACLALEADDRGAHVTLVTRRALRERPYDVDASWLGPRRLTAYAAADPAGRRALIDVARDGGTIPPAPLAELRARAAAGRIALHEATDVERVVSAAVAAAPPPVIWLATGFVQDVASDPLVAPLIGALDVPIHGGLPEVDDHLRLGSAPIFVTGPYAALTVGPACRNLAGARPAAQRIADGLAGSAVIA